MPSRLEVELTSDRGDGTWTWRAAGARQPRGMLDASLLQPGAAVGDVVRVEADVEVDGTTVTAVLPPKAKRAEPERLELIAPPPPPQPVTSSLSGRGERGRDRDRDRGSRRPTGDERRPQDEARTRPGRRPDRPDRPVPSERSERRERAPRPSRGERPGKPATTPKPRPKRLQPKRVHRDAALASLPEEERPVAEQVLRGGLAAVRQGLAEQHVKPDAMLALAERLLPRLKAAEWRDRAEAAASTEDIALKDLRAVVVGAEGVARDDESRALAARLRTNLEQRLEHETATWTADITTALDEGRVVRALRLAARPPEPGTAFPDDLSERLRSAASAAMAPDVAPDRWAAVLEAVLTSPVRRKVEPVGLPQEADERVIAAARAAAPRVPALGALLGIERPKVGAGARPRPPAPPPPRPTAAS